MRAITWRWRNALRRVIERGTLGHVSESGLDEYARLLGDVAEIDSVWVDPEVAPSDGSLAAMELRAAQGQPGRDGTNPMPPAAGPARVR